MAQSIEINDDEKDILWAETTELSPSEVAQIRTRTDLADLKKKLEAQSPNGELLKALKSELSTNSQSDSKLQTELPAAKAENAQLKSKVEKPSEEVKMENLPYAPTTTFNMVRLAQLGFFPTDYSESLQGEWSKLTKWQKVRKWNQSLYVGIHATSSKVEKFSDSIYLGIFDTNAKWAKFNADILRWVQKELNAWAKVNPDQKPRLDSANGSIAAMETAFAAGKYDEGYKHFDEVAKSLKLNTSGDWHTKSDAERQAEKRRIAWETAVAQWEATWSNTALEQAKKIKKAFEADVKAKQKKVDTANQDLQRNITTDSLDPKYTDLKNGIHTIDSRIVEIDRIRWEITRDPTNPSVPDSIRTQFNKILNHPMMNDTAPNIRTAISAQGFQNPDGSIWGIPGNKLELAQQALAAAVKSDKPAMTQLYNNELARSTDLQLLQKYRTKVFEYVLVIEAEKAKLQALRPQVEARNTEQKKLEWRENKLPEVDKRIAKRDEKMQSATATATEKATRWAEISVELDKLTNPDISNAEKVQINDKLTTLIGVHNPETAALLVALKAAPKWPAWITERTRIIAILRSTLGIQETSFEAIKERLNKIHAEIEAIRTEQKTALESYDALAKKDQAWKWAELEALREKAKWKINELNAKREALLLVAGTDFDKAKVSLPAIQYDALLKSSPMAKYFDKIDKFNIQLESNKTGSGKAMRWMYGALMLAWVAQIGMTAKQDSNKAFIYAGDMAAGFLPFGIGWVYDIANAAYSGVTGKNYWTWDKVTRSDALTRWAMGVVGVVTFWASNVLKWVATADKAYNVAKMALTASKGVWHGYVLWESAHLGYGLVDIGRSLLAEGDGFKQNWEALKQNNPDLPAQQKWWYFVVPNGYEVNGKVVKTP